MFHAFLKIKTMLVIASMAILLFIIVLVLLRSRATEEAALALVAVAETRAGLTAFYSERGGYPKAESQILGGQDAGVLCLFETGEGNEGFVADAASCGGRVVVNFRDKGASSALRYSSSGSSYRIEFQLPAAFGAFKAKGLYCASEKGILVGHCEAQ